jgi:dihydrolipoyl dehydrogenase
MKSYDVLILGSGPAGLELCYMLAGTGKSVCFIEKEEKSFGGACVNYGCMPTKQQVQSAEFVSAGTKASQFGVVHGTARIDMKTIFQQKNGLIGQLSHLHKEMTQADKIYGHGRFIGNEVIEVTKVDGHVEQVRGDIILIGTGARPRLIPGIEIDGKVVCTSDDLLNNDTIPKRLLVVGGGVIGLEFASIYRAFGSDVTVIEAMSQLMPNEDSDTGEIVQQCLEARGIKVCVNTFLDQIEVSGDLAQCSFKGDNSGLESYDKVLIGIGRQPNIDNIGLENTDIDVDKGFIKVDDYLQTKVSHIYAAGDVISTAMLAHTAVYEAMIIAANLKDPKSKRYENKVTPRVVYSSPEIAATGLTEKDAQEQYDDIRVINFPLEMSPKAIICKETEGRVKLIYRAGCGTLVGANLIGKASTEVIHELNLAVTCGLTIEQLKNTVHAHPTMSESIWFALLKGQPFQSTAEWMAAMQEQVA